MKTLAELIAWLERELSYDASGTKECPECGRGGYTYWIDHKSALVGNMMVFLDLWPRGGGFPRGAIHDAAFEVFEDAHVTGNAKQDAPALAECVFEKIFGHCK